MGLPGRAPGYRAVGLAEVKPLCDALLERDTPLARELCDALEGSWEAAYAAPVAKTVMHFYPPPAAAELLSELLAEVRSGGPA